jgi:hypothetical protein
MAAKAKAKTKATKASKSAAKTKAQKAKARKPTSGLSAAQVRAYNKASQAATKAARIQSNADKLRAKRLATAKRVTAIQRKAYKTAAAQRVVEYAVKKTYQQTVSGHQNAYVRLAAAKRLFRATSIASSRKFVALGIGTHAHTSRMQTLTAAQALSYEKTLSAKARVRAKRQLRKPKAAKKSRKPAKKAKVGLSKAAVSAGLAAAHNRKLVAAAARAAQSKKKSVKAKAKPKAGTVTAAVNPEWITAGNDQGSENCLAVAIANHLLAWTGYRMTDDQVNSIKGETAYDALSWIEDEDPFENIHIGMKAELHDYDIPGSLICFDSPNGEHAGVLIPAGLVSWGEIQAVPETVTEAYYVRWSVDE